MNINSEKKWLSKLKIILGKRWVKWCLIFLGYVLISTILTYPLVFQTEYLIGPKMDNMQSFWNATHFEKWVRGIEDSLLYTNSIFYPNGVSLLMHTMSYFNLVQQFIFRLFTTDVHAYNFTIFFSFVFAGFFTHLLSYRFTKNHLASFIGGIIFAFSPYHISRALFHINLSAVYFFPLITLLLYRLKDSVNYKNGTLLAAAFLFLILTDYYYVIFALVLIGLFILIYSLKELRSNLKFIGYVIGAIGIAILVTFPILSATFKVLTNNTYENYGGIDVYFFDLISFITIPDWHPVLGDASILFQTRIWEEPSRWVSWGFLGFTVIIISILGLFNKKIKKIDRIFWGVVVGLCVLLSLGPILHVAGVNTRIPLPYFFLQKIPLFNIARVPFRWIVLVNFGLAVLSSFGVMWLFSKFERIRQIIIFIIILFIICFEYLAIPIEYTEFKASEFYSQISTEEEYGIFDVPCDNWDSGQSEYMYLQTIHNKNLIHAELSRISHEDQAFFVQNGFEDYCRMRSTDLDIDVLKENNIKYVVLHLEYLPDEEKGDNLLNHLEDNFDIYYQDNQILVFEIIND